jgi:hypothetical protein
MKAYLEVDGDDDDDDYDDNDAVGKVLCLII